MSQDIFRGTPCRAYATFTDPSDVTTPPLDTLDPLWPGSGSGKKLVDPATVVVSVMRGNETLLVNDVAWTGHPSAGRFYYDFIPDTTGSSEERWYVRFKGTGANPGLLEYEFLVEKSRFA